MYAIELMDNNLVAATCLAHLIIVDIPFDTEVCQMNIETNCCTGGCSISMLLDEERSQWVFFEMSSSYNIDSYRVLKEWSN
jgi:hypothetical protein